MQPPEKTVNEIVYICISTGYRIFLITLKWNIRFMQNECPERLFLQEIKKPLRASPQGQPSATYPQPKSDFINT
ncbi:MAG: hypothetical protein FJ121_10730 [Deltaproteobacteria bacterium]|nr:hypothetical protein [Deltaproteobacteria bacterium]